MQPKRPRPGWRMPAEWEPHEATGWRAARERGGRASSHRFRGCMARSSSISTREFVHVLSTIGRAKSKRPRCSRKSASISTYSLLSYQDRPRLDARLETDFLDERASELAMTDGASTRGPNTTTGSATIRFPLTSTSSSSCHAGSPHMAASASFSKAAASTPAATACCSRPRNAC